ncbi:PDZ domain-containing protein [Microbulbifer taiwanensis]|uniref:PDZ domain-containing protein n=1 Tax=Microbulbifer taiwanensis TaxID=986746 RepID=A0ABW1YJV5_9GAMM|nr:PDZ domain-containing protein [Microbulbifer taiwanensis]
MQIGKPTLISAVTLLLILVTYAVNGALTQNKSAGTTSAPGTKSGLARLFSGADDSLERRIENLETSLTSANRIQSELLELVEELHQRLDHYAPRTSEEGRTAAVNMVDEQHAELQPQHHSRREHYRRHRDRQLQRMIDAGLNPDRAEYILAKQERFQYEHMKLSYEYRHLKNKSSDEAKSLREQLNVYSHPRKMFEHELGEQEFELYLEANGGRQEMRIDRVVADTPASSAGLQPGDRIVSYNGERVFHMGDLRTQVYRVAPGQTVRVEVQREGSSSREVIYVPSGPLGIQG